MVNDAENRLLGVPSIPWFPAHGNNKKVMELIDGFQYSSHLPIPGLQDGTA